MSASPVLQWQRNISNVCDFCMRCKYHCHYNSICFIRSFIALNNLTYLSIAFLPSLRVQRSCLVWYPTSSSHSNGYLYKKTINGMCYFFSECAASVESGWYDHNLNLQMTQWSSVGPRQPQYKMATDLFYWCCSPSAYPPPQKKILLISTSIG